MLILAIIIGMGASIVFAINGCPQTNHNRGNGEIIKHGSCIPRKNSQGVVSHYTRTLYPQGTKHADCEGVEDLTVHCSLDNRTVQKGTYVYASNDTACIGSGTPSSVQSFVLKFLSVANCDYKPEKPESGE